MATPTATVKNEAAAPSKDFPSTAEEWDELARQTLSLTQPEFQEAIRRIVGREAIERVRTRINAEAYEEWDSDLGTKTHRTLLPSRVDFILDEEAAR